MSEAERFHSKVEMIKELNEKLNSNCPDENFASELERIQNEHPEALDEHLKRWHEENNGQEHI